jgi:hypothetical protein
MTVEKKAKCPFSLEVGKMTDEEIEDELLSMRNLALWLYRNDEGIARNSEYHDFVGRLTWLREEAFERRIDGFQHSQDPAFCICVKCGERFAVKTECPTRDEGKKMAFGVCSACSKRLVSYL